ncbi:acyl-CoA dehydrogenase family protein [Streptomyces sp. NY05-11A]|uniref:acyl-CoA dehydrogenase family protein n=1 Tax=Streptomyces soliscabiei TaxID=588897 RepID=UPI0029BDED76|nr:acyl-CoA dehydrogenase family protein [Streptomyces sp. NY05-11A]MDX2676695.1 acyl-CoA dehydrogenase family protein [Streptomyces sp. NY05-11A]
MHLAETAAQLEMRARLRAYFAELMTPEVREELRVGHYAPSATAVYRRVIRRLGEDGWLGVGWPKELGGQGFTMVEQAIFNDEAARANVPVPLLTINSIGPAIAAHGTPEQRETLVRGILRGEVHFAVGYSEPEAGTDLASLRTRAVRDGDEYVINGQKLWTGVMEAADYLWLAVRTDPEAPKHRGISILVVPRHAPGVSSTRLRTLGDHSVAAVGLDNVRVPVENCIGGENNGWAMITGQLNTERVAVVATAPFEQILASVREWAAGTKAPDGSYVLDDPSVRQALARLHARIEFQRLLNAKLATAADTGRLDPAEVSAAKVFGSELAGHARHLLHEVVGLDSGLDADSPGAVGDGRFAKIAGSSNVMTFIGGANEIQRDLIAQLGLGLPRAKR